MPQYVSADPAQIIFQNEFSFLHNAPDTPFSSCKAFVCTVFSNSCCVCTFCKIFPWLCLLIIHVQIIHFLLGWSKLICNSVCKLVLWKGVKVWTGKFLRDPNPAWSRFLFCRKSRQPICFVLEFRNFLPFLQLVFSKLNSSNVECCNNRYHMSVHFFTSFISFYCGWYGMVKLKVK